MNRNVFFGVNTTSKRTVVDCEKWSINENVSDLYNVLDLQNFFNNKNDKKTQKIRFIQLFCLYSGKY